MHISIFFSPTLWKLKLWLPFYSRWLLQSLSVLSVLLQHSVHVLQVMSPASPGDTREQSECVLGERRREKKLTEDKHQGSSIGTEIALEKLFLPQKIRQRKSLLSLDSLKRVYIYFFFVPSVS